METSTINQHDLGNVGKDLEHGPPFHRQRDFSGQTLTEELVKVSYESFLHVIKLINTGHHAGRPRVRQETWLSSSRDTAQLMPTTWRFQVLPLCDSKAFTQGILAVLLALQD